MNRSVLARRGSLAVGATLLGAVVLTGCAGASASPAPSPSAECGTSAAPTGDAATTDETSALAIVVGGHANMPGGALAGEAAEAADEAVAAESHLTVVVADGKPYTLLNGSLVIDAANDIARDKIRKQNRADIDTAVAKAAAQTPESDLLGALDLAARSIASVDGSHTIVVVDSGLSTAGALDFTQPGMLDADPTEVAASLLQADQLPDLTGADVVFSGLGDTADPQAELDHAQRDHLAAIWTAVAEAAGATVEVEQTPLEGDGCAGLPSVTPVELPAPAQCSGGTITLAGGDVAFLPNSAEFVDPAAAQKILQPIADQMKTEQLSATLTGTTANVGDMPGQIDLSQKRAQAVADVLTDLGVPSALNVIGLGSDFPEFVQDHDAAGNLLPGPAAANRKVTIALSGSAGTVDCG